MKPLQWLFEKAEVKTHQWRLGMDVKRFSKYLSVALIFYSGSGCQIAHAQTCPTGNQRVAPNERYTDHGNGTVTDRLTGLMWMKCSLGQTLPNCSEAALNYNWPQALVVAANSNFADYTDWRLPNSRELQTLAETGCHDPAINLQQFPNTPPAFYWSSTTFTSSGVFANGIDFADGRLIGFVKGAVNPVRLVRNGN